MVAATIAVRPMQYLREEDAKLLKAGRVLTFDIIIGLHELLGHGSGKLFHEFANGTFDFDVAKTVADSVGKYGKVQKWSGKKLKIFFLFFFLKNFILFI